MDGADSVVSLARLDLSSSLYVMVGLTDAILGGAP